MPFEPRQVTDKEILKDVDGVLFEYSLALMEYRTKLRNGKPAAATPKPKSKEGEGGHSTTLK